MARASSLSPFPAVGSAGTDVDGYGEPFLFGKRSPARSYPSDPWLLGSDAIQVRFTRSKVSQFLGEMCVPRSSRTVAQSLPLQTLQFVDKSFVPFERPHGFIT